MRWTRRISTALVLVWAAFFISPYVSLLRLAHAVQANDVANIEQRVNFRAVRISLAKQLIPAYLVATGRGSELKGPFGQAAIGIGSTIADPLLEEYLSPATLGRLLNNETGVLGAPGGSEGQVGVNSIGDAWRLFATSQRRGFRSISFAVPMDKPREEQLRLQMRIKWLGWRLVGVDLPNSVLTRLVHELIRRNPAAT